MFFKIGLFTFGGGYAMIPVIKREVVNTLKVIDEETMNDYIAVAQAAPGMIALNIANLVGRELKGMKGAIAAVLGVVLPSFLIILIIAGVLPQVIEFEMVQYILYGVLMSVIVLLIYAVLDLLKVIRKNKGLIIYAGIITVIMTLLSIHIGLIIVSAFVLGAIHVWVVSRSKTHD
jgi:chromate transporter